MQETHNMSDTLDTKPSLEPMLMFCHLYAKEHILMKFCFKLKMFSKMHFEYIVCWKC